MKRSHKPSSRSTPKLRLDHGYILTPRSFLDPDPDTGRPLVAWRKVLAYLYHRAHFAQGEGLRRGQVRTITTEIARARALSPHTVKHALKFNRDAGHIETRQGLHCLIVTVKIYDLLDTPAAYGKKVAESAKGHHESHHESHHDKSQDPYLHDSTQIGDTDRGHPKGHHEGHHEHRCKVLNQGEGQEEARCAREEPPPGPPTEALQIIHDTLLNLRQLPSEERDRLITIAAAPIRPGLPIPERPRDRILWEIDVTLRKHPDISDDQRLATHDTINNALRQHAGAATPTTFGPWLETKVPELLRQAKLDAKSSNWNRNEMAKLSGHLLDGHQYSDQVIMADFTRFCTGQDEPAVFARGHVSSAADFFTRKSPGKPTKWDAMHKQFGRKPKP